MSPPTPPERALVVRLSSIGDVVHTLPAFMALREAWPETEIGWAVEPPAAPLLRYLPGPVHVHVLDTRRWRREPWRPSVASDAWRQISGLRAAGYQLAIDFQGLAKSAVVARASGAPTLGHARPDLREPIAARLYEATAAPIPEGHHVIQRGLELARFAGATGTSATDPVFPSLAAGEDRASVGEWLEREIRGPFVVVHAASSWPSKCWDPLGYAPVAEALYRQAGLRSVWIWGPGESSLARMLSAHAGEGSHAAPRTTLNEMAALLCRAALFVGGDSAPLHIAVAVRTPVVGVFGPTSPERNGPIDPEDVSVVRRLDCSPCYRRRCSLGTLRCLEEIRPEHVAAAALRRLRLTAAHTPAATEGVS